MRSKIKSFKQIQVLAKKLRRARKKIVFTNGCFDILHLGHVSYLAKAKQFGDALIVGINNDQSVRAIKGRARPINPEKARAGVLAALETVDFIVLFSEETPLRLICAIQPDVLVKGSDWKANAIVGSKEVASWGGRVKRLPLVTGYSTTKTIHKMRKPR